MQGAMDGDAHSLAIAALGWIAADRTMLGRFVAVTGIEPETMRQAAGEPGFLAGVLDFLFAHEPSLVRFCEEAHIDPAALERARQALGGGPAPGPGDLA
ncbi:MULTISPECIES: DUF3572 domain-containing protein [unclassified Roseitalea]|uniref:DUF3572 domain-containing protein n=1 Tax=unclassified Roseitalea TaxID=2639107 RepID=UPI00273D6C30|nr:MULTISPECIES: DUF3572 domain-containing protein [unclassified Roseitalea]